jgi:hypothetical protein
MIDCEKLKAEIEALPAGAERDAKQAEYDAHCGAAQPNGGGGGNGGTDPDK